MSGRRTKLVKKQLAYLLTKVEKPSHDRREAVLYYRDALHWAIIPLYGPTEGAPSLRGKAPRFPGYRDWKCEQLTDEMLNKHFGLGKTSNIGLILKSPHVVVDLDSKHDAGTSAREWLDRQKHLANVPRERTGGGYHLHFECLDLPNFQKRNGSRYKKALAATISPQVVAELFFEPLNVVLSPSVHKKGATYEWEVTGDIPQVSWLQLQEWFRFKAPGEKETTNTPDSGNEKWWSKYTGDLRTLDIVAVARKLRLYGRPISVDEGKHSVKCPWRADHGDKNEGWTPADTSAVIFEAKDGFPGFSCLHQQHGPKSLEEFLAWAESQETGIIDANCSQTRSFRPGQQNKDGRPCVELPRIGRPAGAFASEVGAFIQSHKRWFLRSDRVVEPRPLRCGDGLTVLSFAELGTAEVCTAIEDFLETGTVVRGFWEPTSMNEAVGRMLLGSPRFKRHLDPISRVCQVQLPAIWDGKLICIQSGYDARFQTFTRPDAPKLNRIDFQQAKQLIDQALLGFPWKSQQDLTHAIARLLTPFCRCLMGFSARPPLWFFEANRPRAGKDYLNGIAQIIYYGFPFEDARLNFDGEEVRKRITTALVCGRTAMHFANCRGRIDQAALEQAVTAKFWADRLLGSNDEVQLANEIEFSLSANVGIRFTPDFEPRIRKIRLSYPQEDANSRKFPIPDLHGWVLQNRAALLSAFGALVRNWCNSGRPDGPTAFTSFPEWGRIVGGIMHAAGFPDPCLPHDSTDDGTGDDLTAAMRRLFSFGYAGYPDQWISKQQLYDLISENADDDAIGYFGDLNERSDQTRFGRHLQSFVDRVLNGILLQRRIPPKSERTDRASYRFSKPTAPPRDLGGDIRAAVFDQATLKQAPNGDKGDFGEFANRTERDDRAKSQTKTVGASPEQNNKPVSRQCRQRSPSAVHGKLITDNNRLSEIAEQLSSSQTAAFDIETYGDALNPWGGDIRILSLALPNSPPWLVDLKPIGYDLGPLGAALEAVELIGHNAKFDARWLRVKCGLRLTKIYCTCTASRLLTAGSLTENGLDACLRDHLNLTVSKTAARADWGSMLLTEEQLAYCSNDVVHLHALREVLDEKLGAANLKEVAALEMALLPVVSDIEATGFAVDRTRLTRLRDTAQKEACAAAYDLRNMLGQSINPASPKQLLGALNASGIKLKNTDDQSLAACKEAAPVAAIRRYRAAVKRQQGTQKLLDAIQSDGRIHGQFNPTGADTGRFSSSEPNMQNIERGEVRECFIASAGNTLIVADYSQIELRIAAAIAPEPAMIAAYNAGTDLHLQTAYLVLKKPYADISSEERRLAKALNFGLLYGQTPKGLVRYLKSDFGISISEAEANWFMVRFFGAYSGLRAWQQKCKRLAGNPAVREVRTEFGRRRLLPTGEKQFWQRYTSALNMPIQGGCNDGLKQAMLQLSKALPAGAQVISTIHDELIVEAPMEHADSVKAAVEHEMIRAMEQLYPTVPIQVEAQIRPAWG